jgi:hypothetical protein
MMSPPDALTRIGSPSPSICMHIGSCFTKIVTPVAKHMCMQVCGMLNVAQQALWAERPVDGQPRMLARCRRMYRPQVLSPSVTAAADGLEA